MSTNSYKRSNRTTINGAIVKREKREIDAGWKHAKEYGGDGKREIDAGWKQATEGGDSLILCALKERFVAYIVCDSLEIAVSSLTLQHACMG